MYLQMRPTGKQLCRISQSAEPNRPVYRKKINTRPFSLLAMTNVNSVQHQKHTMPGRRPPSAIPSKARTATKPAKFCTNPKHMVMMPQIAVKNGSQIFGDAFLSTRLLGNSLPYQLASGAKMQWKTTHLQMQVRQNTAKPISYWWSVIERSASKPIIFALPTLVLSKNDMRKSSARIGRILESISKRMLIVMPGLTVYPASTTPSVSISADA